ncbi:MAG: phosphatase PAP2 family protein [Halobacteria archaeon]|nr:phosphatase PAP2 family protein [Halobacteria archaeon]
MVFLDVIPFWPTVTVVGLVILVSRRKWSYATVFLASMLCVGGTAVLLKSGIHAPRPYVELGMNYTTGGFSYSEYFYNHEYGSFPSQHAMSSFAVIPFFHSAFEDYRVTAFLAVFAIVVAYSRVYLYLHYVSDVVVGSALGLGISFLFLWVHEIVFDSN